MVRYFTRDEWGARSWQNRAPFAVPASKRRGVVFHHNGPLLNIKSPEDSAAFVRAIQRYHQIANGWSDSAYSFMFDNWGQIFILRGWVWDQFANGDDVVGEYDGSDTEWYTAMWLGGWENRDEGPFFQQPSALAYEAAAEIVRGARAAGAGDRVAPHNIFQIKYCPGPQLTEWCMRYDRKPMPSPQIQASQAPLPDPPQLTLPFEDEEEDMRTFVKDESGAIYELVQPLRVDHTSGRFIPSTTVKRHIQGAEWASLQNIYGSKLVEVKSSQLLTLESV